MTAEALPLIVKDPAPLDGEYLGAAHPGREAELQELETQIGSGRHCWLHGPPGAGKTSTARRVLGRLEERRVRTVMINCWSTQTFYAVLERAFEELRALVPEMRDVSFKFERLARIARKAPLVFLLDEIDQMFLKERNATLYNLARLDHAGIVCLSQSREAYLALDPRVQSRILPAFIEFPAYGSEQLLAILEDRARRSLTDTAWCRADLERIASGSRGDARTAIQSLRAAAYTAEKDRCTHLRVKDIEEALRQTTRLRRLYALKGLSEHHRLLHRIVGESGPIGTVDLWHSYRARAPAAGLEPMARRTFNQYKQYLITHRFLEERQARGRSNQRLVQVVDA